MCDVLFIQLIDKRKISCVCSVVLSEEIPLTSSDSECNQTPSQPRLGYDSAIDEAERRLLTATNPSASRLQASPQEKSQLNSERNGRPVSLLNTQQDRNNSVGNLLDINAMSVASIYDREHNEIMDADK